jgi:hypothetical protein
MVDVDCRYVLLLEVQVQNGEAVRVPRQRRADAARTHADLKHVTRQRQEVCENET